MAKNLTDYKRAVELFQQSYDYDYLLDMYCDMRRAWGEPESSYSQDAGWPVHQPFNDGIVKFPDVRPTYFEEGKSPRMLVNSNLVVSRLASKEPMFVFEGAKQWQSMVRQQYMLNAMRDSGGPLEWYEEDAKAFDDGDSFGVGTTQIGLVTDRKSGDDKLTARYVHCLQQCWDRFHPSPIRSRWRTSWLYCTPEEAAAQFGWAAVNRTGVIKKDSAEGNARKAFEYCRVFERYDVGHGEKGNPTYMCWLGKVDDSVRPIHIGENNFESNPYADVVNFVKSGMSRPIGRIFMERMDAEMLHSLERYVNGIINTGRAMDIIYELDIVDGDIEKWEAGLISRVRSKGKNDKSPFARIPEIGIPEHIWRAMANYGQRIGEAGSTPDIDKGTSSGGKRTATQIAEEANRVNMNMGWTVSMMVHYRRRQIERSIEVARAGDTMQRQLNLYGGIVTVNDPTNPLLMLKELLKGDYKCLVDESAMTVEADRLQAAFRLTHLEKMRELDPMFQYVDPVAWWEEYIEVGGKDDSKQLLRKVPLPPPAPMEQGQPTLPQGQSPAMGLAMAG